MSHSYHSSFTPSMSDPETLEALFVVREKLASHIMSGIQESAKTGDKHQFMLVGPRGIGKTHLVALLYYRVKQDAALAPLMRIAWLYEDPNLDDYKDLLILILQRLQQEYASEEIGEQLENILDLNNPGQAELALEALLLDFIKQKTLLLIAENFDTILSDIKETGQRKLRAFLQNHPYVTILSTATSLTEAVTKREQTFYGFFNVKLLDPFNTENSISLLTHLAKRIEKPELVEAINSPMGRARISAVHYLAGGNPRIYVLFFDFLTRDSLDSLVQPLMTLIDKLTPYYQSRMNKLSSLQRKIIDVFCKLRCAITVKQIARQSMKTSQTISSSLSELVRLGYVIQVDSIGRSNYYEIREPLMRLCLEVKEHRGKNIGLFVQFLRVWYSEKKMQDLLAEDCSHKTKEYIQEAIILNRTEENSMDKSLQSDFFKQVDTGDYQAALKTINISIERNPDDENNWRKKFRCLENLSYPLEDKLTCLQKIVDLDPKDTESWNRLALLLTESGNYTDALTSYRQALELDSQHIESWGYLFGILKHQGRLTLYSGMLERLTQCFPDQAKLQCYLGVSYDDLGRYENALKAYERALKINPSLSNNKIHVRLYQARSLSVLGKHTEALEILREQAKQPLSPESQCLQTLLKAYTYMCLDRWDEGAKVMDDCLSEYSSKILSNTENLTIISLLIEQNQNPHIWRRFISVWLMLFAKHGYLTLLSDGLVRRMRCFAVPLINNEVAHNWLSVWQELAGKYEEMTLPLRLLQAGVAYKKTQDVRVLLELAREERQLLQPWLVNLFKTDDDETDQEMNQLMLLVEKVGICQKPLRNNAL